MPYDNNHAERAIRPAVLIRKNSYNNRSRRGADAQAVLISVYRTNCYRWLKCYDFFKSFTKKITALRLIDLKLKSNSDTHQNLVTRKIVSVAFLGKIKAVLQNQIHTRRMIPDGR